MILLVRFDLDVLNSPVGADSALDGVAARRASKGRLAPRAGGALAAPLNMVVVHSVEASVLPVPPRRSRLRPPRTGSPSRHLAMPSRLPFPFDKFTSWYDPVPRFPNLMFGRQPG